jgi:hypothetical protein
LPASKRTTALPMKPAPPVTRIRSMRLETRLDVGQERRGAVLVRQDQGLGRHRPIDANFRIIEADRPSCWRL